MIPRRLELRNFMCYRADVPPLDFDGIPIACLSGENGAGKSALLDAMTWALWGAARLRSDDDLIALGETEMMVELTFALDGLDYRVLRKRSKGKRGQSQLEFQVRADAAWRVLTAATLRETQQKIDQTLRMGYDTFSNSAFLRQGHADEFTRKEPSKRKQVLADILGLSVYEQLEDAAKSRTRELDGRVKATDGEIQAYRVQAEKQAFYLDELQRATERAALAEQTRIEAAKQAEAVVERLRVLQARQPLRDERRNQVERISERQTRLATTIEQDARLVAAAHQRLEEGPEIRAGMQELNTTRAEIGRMEGLREAYERLMERRRGHEQALQQEQSQIEKDLARVEGELRSLQEQAARKPRLERDLGELQLRLEQLNPISGELEQQRRSRGELQERSRQANVLRLRRQEVQSGIDKRKDSLIATREEYKRRIREASEQVQHESRWRTELQQARDEQQRLDAEQARIATMRTDAARLAEQTGAMRAACDTIKQQGEQINEKLELLTTDQANCPLCGSELGDDRVEHIQAEYTRERTDLRNRFTQTKREADAMVKQLEELQASIRMAEQQAAGVTEIAGQIARLERDLRMAEETRVRQADLQRQLDDVQVQLVKGDFEQGLRADLARIEAELAAAGSPELLDTELKRTERRIEELERQVTEQADLKAQIQRRRDEIRQIDQNDPALHEQELRQRELTTTLQMGDYGHPERLALKRLVAEIQALGYTPEAYSSLREQEKQLAEWATRLVRLEKAEHWLAENEQRIAADKVEYQRIEQELVDAQAALQALEQELRGLDLATRERDQAVSRLREAEQAQRVAERDLAEKRMLLKQAEEAAATLLEREAARKALVERKGLFEELGQAFGKKGTQALLIETAIPEIEREANRLLAGMTDNQMHMRFETQGETKKGDVTETLDIKIADALGTRDYDAYSGGESFRVDFAIRVALSKLLARRAGARLETLVIDEGFGSQDARGRERLVEAITSVQHDFKQILVVTHIQELKDMFPIQIEITKTPEGSRWMIA